MIAKISKGKDTRKLIACLYGPGRANEHTDPHLVASWDGFAPDPGRTHNVKQAKEQLVQALDLRVKQVGDRAPALHVWHCSVRASPDDRILSDDDWAAIARRIVAATGIAPDGDPDGCRWIAVRHADDHIHIAATKVRGDLRPARIWNDYLTADDELAVIETAYGLHEVERGDRTAAKRPTRAETEKAQRTGRRLTAREHLRTTVRTAVSATTPQEFIGFLSRTDGILVEVLHFPSGDVRGYKVALKDDTNAAGEPVWFSGSALAPDLSYPKIQERLAATEPPPTHQPGDSRRGPNPWHQATAAAERIPVLLEREDDQAAQAHLAAFGEALDALPLIAPAAIRPQLTQAARAFERATRSRIHAEHHHARALRGAVKAMLRQPATADGAALAMFLDAAVLIVMAATRWHDLRHHDQQVTATRQSLIHLHAAYQQAAAEPLAALARHQPPAHTVERHTGQIRAHIPQHAESIVTDPAWPALTAALATAEATGHNPQRLLQQAASERALDDARSPAQILTWRIHRLTQRPAPSARALAAQARTTAIYSTSTPTYTETAAPRRPDPTTGPARRC